MRPEPIVYNGQDKEIQGVIRKLNTYLDRVVEELNTKT